MGGGLGLGVLTALMTTRLRWRGGVHDGDPADSLRRREWDVLLCGGRGALGGEGRGGGVSDLVGNEISAIEAISFSIACSVSCKECLDKEEGFCWRLDTWRPAGSRDLEAVRG